MVHIERIAPEQFDWAADEGPAAEVRRIARASTAHDGAVTLNEQAVLQLKHRGLRDADLWLTLATADPSTGHAGGFALRHGDILDLAVHPEARRQGVGAALAAESLPAGRKVEAWSHGDHPAAARLAERFGVPRERELKIMRRSLSEPLEELTVPEGVRIRGFHPGDEQGFLEVNASAFAHHPEQGHMTLEDFRERTSESWFDPEGLLLAVPAEEGGDQPPLLGFHWTKVHLDEEPPYGEVYVVAVNPKAAGRGLGTVLTNAGLHHLRDRGLGSVLLYVDGDNDPAIAVYHRQGFEVERTEVQYRGTSAGDLRPGG
jgi:mycothiol synthase